MNGKIWGTIIAVLVGVFIFIAGWAVKAADDAKTKAGEAMIKIAEVITATVRLEERIKAIDEKLVDQKDLLKEIKEEVKKVQR